MAEPPHCTETEHLSGRYTVCTFDPAKDTIRLFGTKTLETRGATYDQLNTHLLRNGQHMSFAMNGGMYHPGYGPVGLLVEQGRETGKLNQTNAFGNFFMKPNGVFWVGDGKAGVMETEALAKAGLSPREATQSGPMLVIDGQVHARFLPDATSLQIRNGVGILPDGRVAFAISNDPVRFHDFATLFRDRLQSKNALFLDGSISSLYAPEIRRHDRDAVMGTIIAVVKNLPW
ncbi:phosphodiester glycosidase family protein [Shinella curvata]|uniref:Phosphodiester glycosidase family protein n=1 Tax=Shinella curvata TaxID=1817964 RepID=A0ABT8X810_9HYPH|nr:phosphodiester glycosidase family protein [Shinella curvata]MCJ8052236.1 phosphodiester glycosidase family protein [Shinella curvata]MDO6119815.1 phosphodiester glycosidase family protein [Shinella curvata]